MRRILVMLVLAVVGCGGPPRPGQSITLATTTSTRDSGLLDVLLPTFQQQTGIHVKVIAVGSGQALEMGRRGDADVLLTHSPDAEERFVNDGLGVNRRRIMHNDFVLVGPKSNPAGILHDQRITSAFLRIAGTGSPFISRGDESGTHAKETSIWKYSAAQTAGDWYIRAGLGMTETLRMASEKQAYTLSDRGTFLSKRWTLELVILGAGDPLLENEYAVIVVNPKKHAHVKAEAAEAFATFLLSAQTQTMIGNFGKKQFGEPLFFPQIAPLE